MTQFRQKFVEKQDHEWPCTSHRRITRASFGFIRRYIIAFLWYIYCAMKWKRLAFLNLIFIFFLELCRWASQ